MFDRNAMLATIVITIAWIGLAVRSPHLTYHFAPFAAALAWPALLRRRGVQPRRTAGAAAATSFCVVAAAGVVLHLLDQMTGPTLWHSRPAVVEVLLFAAVAAAVGARVASRQQLGIIGSLIAD